ncbi:MAG: pyridoxamine 5'-phosphate oxidase family protein [Planctomycetaceae bacterium]|jgi:nitroimidazol reductase NimA-like FMN-containing flavoprotein (pyridoxamine 5'-phosphate oxidase superfamily)|nr:pyridoxamine 5'-phosphate oxidase family protein [Planctomycetaceae bacterium]
MRRKDKEISGVDEKIKIIDTNKVCRLALSENDQPYIVPLNYGYSFENNVLTFYFHSAKEGRKLEIIKKNNRACFEIDCGGHLIAGEKPCRYGYTFKSVIGTGKIIFLDAINEKINGLNKLMQHQTGKNEMFDFDKITMERIIVYKMVVEEFTGKEDLSQK